MTDVVRRDRGRIAEVVTPKILAADNRLTIVGKRGVSYSRGGRILLHTFLIVVAIGWLIPIGAAIYASFRFFESDTAVNGIFSMPETLTLENYRTAWNVGEIRSHFFKTAFIVLPALFLILFLSSMVAFACTRFSWRFNIFFLVLFTAGNLMPRAGDLPAAVPDLQVGSVARPAQRHRHRKPARHEDRA